ncbi:MAG: alpha/beta fold hydrolase [Erysipelotrichaceae bacterium]|nr:alpha/beta fold hydrolase [Erysipelotrichaceae bacterium]
MSIQKKELRLAGGRIAATLFEKEEGRGPLVICSHELGVGRMFTFPYARALAQNGYRALTFDFCGGSPDSESEGKTTEMSVLTEIQDLKDVITDTCIREELDPSKIILLGCSQGAVVSALTSLQMKPKALILLYPALHLSEHNREMFFRKEEIPEEFHIFDWVTLGRKYALDIWDLDVFQEIARISVPTLLLHGDADPVVPLAYAQKASQTIPDVEYHVIPQGGHGFFGEAQEKARTYILDFLQEKL